jgi:hypothetical protein
MRRRRKVSEVTTAYATDAARRRLALTQTALLSALVAGAEVPEGFDRARVAVQSRALLAKRAGVVAKTAPELPEILGEGFRTAFLGYAMKRPLPADGYRRDALTFVEWLIGPDGRGDGPGRAQVPGAAARRALTAWWRERAGPAPLPPAGRVQTLGRAVARFTRSGTGRARSAFSRPGRGGPRIGRQPKG